MSTQTNKGTSRPSGHLGVRVVRDERKPSERRMDEIIDEAEEQRPQQGQARAEVILGWITLVATFVVGMVIGYLIK